MVSVPGIVLVLCAFSVVPASGGQSARAESSPLGLSAVTAEFVPAEFATHYTVEAVDLSGTPKYSWRLTLELVDKPSAVDPTNPLSAAAVDPGCDNNHYGLSASDTSHSTEFVWHHPDAKDSIPPGRYHCNHLLEGPSGHQGVVTVTVTQGSWVCTASYDGTNSGKGKAASCLKQAAKGPPTSTTTTTAPGPSLIPLHGSPVDGPIETAKNAAAQDAQDSLEIAKHGGLLAFIPGFKEEKRMTGLAAGTQSAAALGVAKSLKMVKEVAEVIGDATSVVFYVGAYFETVWANDPPDSNYKPVVNLKVSAGAKVSPSSQISTALAGSMNALMENDAMFVANLQAMTLSFERAQGALNARSAKFESKQISAASRFAFQASALIATQPKLEKRVWAALKATTPSISIDIPAKLVAPFAAAERSTVPAAGFLQEIKGFGFSNKQGLAAWSLFANATSASDVTLPSLLNSRSAATGDASLAKSLKNAAVAFAKIAKQSG